MQLSVLPEHRERDRHRERVGDVVAHQPRQHRGDRGAVRDAAPQQRAHHEQRAREAHRGERLIGEQLGQAERHEAADAEPHPARAQRALPDTGGAQIGADLEQRRDAEPGGLRLAQQLGEAAPLAEVRDRRRPARPAARAPVSHAARTPRRRARDSSRSAHASSGAEASEHERNGDCQREGNEFGLERLTASGAPTPGSGRTSRRTCARGRPPPSRSRRAARIQSVGTSRSRIQRFPSATPTPVWISVMPTYIGLREKRIGPARRSARARACADRDPGACGASRRSAQAIAADAERHQRESERHAQPALRPRSAGRRRAGAARRARSSRGTAAGGRMWTSAWSSDGAVSMRGLLSAARALAARTPPACSRRRR